MLPACWSRILFSSCYPVVIQKRLAMLEMQPKPANPTAYVDRGVRPALQSSHRIRNILVNQLPGQLASQ